MPSKHATGFTLVEILIVVTILGILAAIVVPHFQSNANAARDTSVVVQLKGARKSLQLWNSERGGEFPTLAQMQEGIEHWAGFIGKSDLDGTLNVAGDYGPYMPKAPVNVLTRSSLVADVGSATAEVGWTYDESSGVLRVVIPSGTDLTGFGLGADDVEQLAP